MTKKTNKPRSVRASAFNESQYPTDVSGTRCVKIMIPDDPKYLHQLAGLVALATKRANYSNVDPNRVQIIAEKWLDAYIETDWNACMTCEDIRDCIENDSDVRNSIIGASSGSRYPVNTPLPTGETSRNLAQGTNETCDLDVLWAQCLAVVQETNRVIVDLLERMEIESNTVELAGVAASAPGLENLGIASVTDFINITQEAIAENYNAAYTTAYETELACDIFCVSRSDCELNIDDMYDIVLARAQASITGVTGSWLNIAGFLLDLADYEISSVNVCDFAFLLCYGGLKLANWLTPFDIGTRVLELVLALKADEPSNDWETLCVDCPSDVLEMVWLTNPTSSGLTYNTDGGVFGAGARWIASPFEMTVLLPVNKHMTHVRVRAAFGGASGVSATINGIEYELPRGALIGGSTYDYEADIPDIFDDTVLISLGESRAVSHVWITVEE